MLGPGEGQFELGVESFDCVNVEDREAEYLSEGRRKALEADQGIAYVMSKGRDS